MNSPPHSSRSHRTSSQVGSGVCVHSTYACLKVGVPLARVRRLGALRSGIPPSRNRSAHPGRESPMGRNSTRVERVTRSGMVGLPQSRRLANDQSRVRMSPFAPAWRACSTRSAMSSRVPTQYSWKNALGLAAATSSNGMLANELSPIAVPAAAAARATATSPPGSTAWAPAGETMTGKEISCPMTVVLISR